MTNPECMTLGKYATHLGIDECGVWGVYYVSQEQAACGTIWTSQQRATLMQYLEQAQKMIEEVIDYPLCPTWISQDNRRYSRLIHTRWKHFLAAGVRATAVVSAGVATDLTLDPVHVGPVATVVTDSGELVVYHPGTTTVIEPSLVTLSGGNADFYIPRCRLVKTDLEVNPVGGLDYDDDNNFETTVDIGREYNDDTTQAILVWPTGKTCCSGCGEETDTACEAVINPTSGYIKLTPARVVAGTWTAGDWLCSCPPPYVRLHYKAGERTLSILAMDAIIRLAHSMMPEGPCGCDIAQTHWKRDRHVPDFVAPERMRVPWGFTDGAWYAWSWTQLMIQRRVSVL